MGYVIRILIAALDNVLVEHVFQSQDLLHPQPQALHHRHQPPARTFAREKLVLPVAAILFAEAAHFLSCVLVHWSAGIAVAAEHWYAEMVQEIPVPAPAPAVAVIAKHVIVAHA